MNYSATDSGVNYSDADSCWNISRPAKTKFRNLIFARRAILAGLRF